MRIHKNMAVIVIPWRNGDPVRYGVAKETRGRMVLVDFGGGDPEYIDRGRVTTDTLEGLACANAHKLWLKLMAEEEEERYKAIQPIREKYQPLLDDAAKRMREFHAKAEAKAK